MSFRNVPTDGAQFDRGAPTLGSDHHSDRRLGAPQGGRPLVAVTDHLENRRFRGSARPQGANLEGLIGKRRYVLRALLAAILVTRAADQMRDEQQRLFERIADQCPDVLALRQIALSFRGALTARTRHTYENGLKERNGVSSAMWSASPTDYRRTSRQCRRPRYLMEYRSCGGADQSPQDDQTPNLRLCWF